MLKIKGDLKELEKFGFHKDKYERYVLKVNVPIRYYYDNGKDYIEKEYDIDTLIVEKNKFIDRVSFGGVNSDDFNRTTNQEYDTLYDLIKADMVEKI